MTGVDDDPRILVDEEFLDCDGTGISVSHADGLDFGIVERKHPNGPFATPLSLLTIKHEDNFLAVNFIEGRTKATDGSGRDFEVVFEGDSHNIQPGSQSRVRVIFSPKYEGLFKATLELIFYHTQVSVYFVVRRELQGIAGSLKDHKHFESLGQADNLGAIKSRATRPQKTVLLLSPNRRRRSRYLSDYGLPPIVQEALDKSSDTQSYDENAPGLISALKPDGLYMSTYAHYFNALLAVEDGHQQWDVKRQSTYEVDLQGRDHLFSIEIENNDEDLLPEVALGDFLWLDDIHDDIRYEARVTNVDVFIRHHLAVLKVSLRLPTDFNLYKGSRVKLRFRHNHSTLRRQYHALTAALAPPRRLLFPSVSDIKPIRRLSRAEIDKLKFRQLVNRDIRDDGQQLQAVISILEQSPGSVPFIIYGPPGTGKTSTVVESVVQLVRRDAGVRVLVCTPSNAAADLLAKRLAAAGLDSDKLYRLDAPMLYEDDILQDVQTSSLFPGLERLLAFRVVLSTCSSASMLRALDVPVGHFSHIVIDEAAEAEEPLAMIPIMGFSNAYTNVILAGDPNELGPIIKSATAARAGLGKSYLERLMLMDEVYGLDTQDGKAIVGLHRNHRSHGNIIAWSNRYFYEDRMRDYGNSYITYHLVLSDVLPKKGFSVVFHGVKGNEQHAKWSPSYFNIIEASIVRDYCLKLTGDPKRKIYPEEIGVLAPYRSQVRAIRELLKVANLSDISVGSVEQFMGQERKVIILATTRGNEENHPGNGVGFLMSPQRTNVAITRAQALLIVIGDPDVLGKDKLWHTFLDYIESRKGWTGKMHNWKPKDVVHLPEYEIVPGKGDVAHGEEFIGGKSEKIRRSSDGSGG
ncbi:P-loop containing nucleoside triphosphate hydrolase protein [Russula emetica]|nr:P-loop containing nucleoside triphosphate hydrolase protein [Russula emetica]